LESSWRRAVAEKGWSGDGWDYICDVLEGPHAGLELRGRFAPPGFATVGSTLFLADDRQVFVPLETFTGYGMPFGLVVNPD